MITNQIKSMLRNKANVIYLVIIIVLLLGLNITINLNAIIDNVYDKKICNKNGMGNIEELKNIEVERIIYINNGYFKLNKDIEKEIRNINHVEDLKITKMADIDMYYIIVDDWKNIEYVQDILDNKGISIDRVLGGIEIQSIFKSYSQINMAVKIVKWIIYIMIIFILYASYSNILKNERDNIKLLNILGYNKSKIKLIIYIDLLILISLSYIISILLFIILVEFIKIKYALNLQFIISKILIINIFLIVIPLIININKNLKSLIKEKRD